MDRWTYQVAVMLAGCLTAAPICAVEKDGLTITITQEEDDACTAGGGCYLVPKQVVYDLVQTKVAEAYDEGMKACHGRDRL